MPAGPTTFALAFPGVFLALQTDRGRELLPNQAVAFDANLSLAPVAAANAEEVLETYRQEAPNTGARAWEALQIPNGNFTIEDRTEENGSIFDFQIYTVQRGTLAGNRVIKVSDSNGPGGYRAFAFVNRDGIFQLWTRFRSHQDHEYVQAAVALTGLLRREARNLSIGGEFAGYTLINMNRTCRLCNAAVHFDSSSATEIGVCINHTPHANPERNRAGEAATQAQERRGARAARTSARRAAVAASAPLPDGRYRINRLNPLPVCENGTGAIQ